MSDLPFIKRRRWWTTSSTPSSSPTSPPQQQQQQSENDAKITRHTTPRQTIPIRDNKSPPQQSPLLDLPAELRAHIWEYVYPGIYHCRIIIEYTPVLLLLGPIKQSSSEAAFPSSPAAIGLDTKKAEDCTISPLLRTCRTIYTEAAPILYDRTVFHFLIFGLLQRQIPRNGVPCLAWNRVNCYPKCYFCGRTYLPRASAPTAAVDHETCLTCMQDRCIYDFHVKELGPIKEWPVWPLIRRLEVRLPRRTIFMHPDPRESHDRLLTSGTGEVEKREHILRISHALSTASLKTCIVTIEFGPWDYSITAQQVILRMLEHSKRRLSLPYERGSSPEGEDSEQLLYHKLVACADKVWDRLRLCNAPHIGMELSESVQ